jgi:hypothetical protein
LSGRIKVHKRVKHEIDPSISLSLGDEVQVRRICTVEYDEKGVKKLEFEEVNLHATLIGRVKRALGTYVHGCRGLAGGEWESGSLKVSEYVWLCECRVTLTGKPFLVHGKDLMIWE